MKCLLALAAVIPFAATAQADEADLVIVRRLVSIVRDPRCTASQRIDAAQSLAKIGPKAVSVLDELSTQLQLLKGREQESLQEAVVLAIGSIGPAAKGALPDLARASGRSIDLDLAIQTTKNQLLVDTPTYELQLLTRDLTSKNELKRLAAAKALGQLGNTAALPDLTLALADPDGDVRRACIAAIRKLAPRSKPSKELIQAYITDLTDPEDTIRLLAVRALGKLGAAAAEAAGPIQNLTTDPDRDVRRAAAEALANLAAP